jgi:hypothetical protein
MIGGHDTYIWQLTLHSRDINTSYEGLDYKGEAAFSKFDTITFCEDKLW